MLNKEGQAIFIIEFLVTSFRDARNHNGDYEPILQALSKYLEVLKKEGKMSDKGLDILYLKGKIRADEDQLQRHKLGLSKSENAEE